MANQFVNSDDCNDTMVYRDAQSMNGPVNFAKHKNGFRGEPLVPNVPVTLNRFGESKKARKIDPYSYDDIVYLADVIKKLANLEKEPTIGIICGSGLGMLADRLTDGVVLPFNQIPSFPTPNVKGHHGNLVFGNLEGKFVVCLQGRFHPYEQNMNLALCSMPVRIMHLLGVTTLIVSNAAGSLNPRIKPGDVMIIKDHIFMPGLVGFSPLVGVNDPRFGERFVSMHNAYDKDLRIKALKIAKKHSIGVVEGIYVMSGGPQYETPAECFLYKACGADALGMSTCHEVTVGIQSKMKVFGISLIANYSRTDVNCSIELSHKEVLEMAVESGKKCCRLISTLVQEL